jgi:hypothetical protein
MLPQLGDTYTCVRTRYGAHATVLVRGSMVLEMGLMLLEVGHMLFDVGHMVTKDLVHDPEDKKHSYSTVHI